MRILLRPHLLTLLSEGRAHGYHLYDCLLERGFHPDRLDSSVVYRELRDMEDQGLIASRWEDDSMGPRRRVYHIQPEGRRCLADMVEDLREMSDRVQGLISDIITLEETGGRKP